MGYKRSISVVLLCYVRSALVGQMLMGAIQDNMFLISLPLYGNRFLILKSAVNERGGTSTELLLDFLHGHAHRLGKFEVEVDPCQDAKATIDPECTGLCSRKRLIILKVGR